MWRMSHFVAGSYVITADDDDDADIVAKGVDDLVVRAINREALRKWKGNGV